MALESTDVQNVNPQRFSKKSEREVTKDEENDDVEDPIDEREIFGMFCLLTISLSLVTIDRHNCN